MPPATAGEPTAEMSTAAALAGGQYNFNFENIALERNRARNWRQLQARRLSDAATAAASAHSVPEPGTPEDFMD